MTGRGFRSACVAHALAKRQNFDPHHVVTRRVCGTKCSLRVSSACHVTSERKRETSASLFFSLARRPFCYAGLIFAVHFLRSRACNSISARWGTIVASRFFVPSCNSNSRLRLRSSESRGFSFSRISHRSARAIGTPRRQVVPTNWKLIQLDRGRSLLFVWTECE